MKTQRNLPAPRASRQAGWFGLIALLAIIAFVTTFNYGGCGGGGGSKSGSSAPATTISFSGTFDGSVGYVSRPGSEKSIWDYFCDLFRPNYAYAVVATIDNIIAVSPDASYVFATKSGNEFSLALTKGKEYIIVLLNGTNIVGIYKADNVTGMDAFPTSTNSTDTNLGTVSVTLGMAEGTISSTVLLQNLGITQDVATAFGVMDEGMVRFSNIDVDGNDQIDMLEGKYFTLKIGYQFRPTESFDDLFIDYSSYTNSNFAFYFYVYEGTGTFGDAYALYDWPEVTMTLPSTITTTLGRELDVLRNGTDDANFMGDDAGGNDRYIIPAQPPQGTYIISLPLKAGGAPKILTFNNVKSFDMTGVGLNYVYVPEVKLTKDGDGKITTIEWRWWKKASGVWVQPTDEELSAVWYAATYYIATDNNSGGWAELPITAIGSVTLNPPVQPSTTVPNSFQMGAQDKGRYSYSFDWWEGVPP